MKNAILLAVVLAFSTALWAQGDQPEQFCYRAQDDRCNGAGNCASVSFTPVTNTTIYFRCQIACANGVDVAHCKVTATLTQAGATTPLATCKNWNEQGCWDNSSATPISVNVQQGVTYTVTACLESCGPEDCCSNCRAGAWAYEKEAECPAP